MNSRLSKISDFLRSWGCYILLTLILLKTCSINSNLDKSAKNNKKQMDRLDSLIKVETISKEEFNKMLTIEGLRTEKRMIQSTDRKILDVNRQSEIDKEIERLESK